MKMREDHQEKMKELNAFKIFFVDECATNDAMVPLYSASQSNRSDRVTRWLRVGA